MYSMGGSIPVRSRSPGRIEENGDGMRGGRYGKVGCSVRRRCRTLSITWAEPFKAVCVPSLGLYYCSGRRTLD